MMLRWFPDRLTVRLSQEDWQMFENKKKLLASFPIPFNPGNQVSLDTAKVAKFIWTEKGIQIDLPSDLITATQDKKQPLWKFHVTPSFVAEIEVDYFSEAQRAKRKGN